MQSDSHSYPSLNSLRRNSSILIFFLLNFLSFLWPNYFVSKFYFMSARCKMDSLFSFLSKGYLYVRSRVKSNTCFISHTILFVGPFIIYIGYIYRVKQFFGVYLYNDWCGFHNTYILQMSCLLAITHWWMTFWPFNCNVI